MAGFRTSVRAVEMLGRQQIAGIPTAISELVKNAHDAYADRVEVDYYRSDKLFVLRDDGIGMTEAEFLERWLTLGTESKLGEKSGLVLPYRPPEKPERPLSGKKGIGRLSIAVLGPQVLVLTRADADLELTQIGMAMGMIQHEFNMNVRTLKDSIRDLKAWTDLNDSLKGLYRDFRDSFEHLDGYLTLLDPTRGRLRRSRMELRGGEIENFLLQLFGERCRRHEVTIKATRAFQKKTVTTFPSSILPVFVNLTDNALFWLGDREGPRTITLDANDQGYLFSDNGRGIPDRDRETVFEQGFTRKPGGRGLGLFISRQALRGTGFTLELLDPPAGGGARFRIGPEADGEENGE
uniref:histidine kinase n=1 Tax=Candidatus Kentrum sp. FW TaxID=2126338 RepID=A0A450TE94_9GAMM|nr:MAG: Histidine kinase-, DNA gyrase B-, and HSP90-like ATPase [Candidatus Kentron sp. FW]